MYGKMNLRTFIERRSDPEKPKLFNIKKHSAANRLENILCIKKLKVNIRSHDRLYLMNIINYVI